MAHPHSIPVSVKLIAGSLFLLIGLIAIFAPWISALPIDLVIGWLFLVGGIAYVLIAFYENGISFWLTLSTGVASAITGWLLITGSLSGFLTVVVIVAFYLLFEGISRIILSVERMPDSPPSFFILSGILACILAIALGITWSAVSPWFFSVAIGGNMAFYGFLHIFSAVIKRRKTAIETRKETHPTVDIL